MSGAFSVRINYRDVSSFISLDSLRDFTIRAEGPILWDFMTDSLTLEARVGIFDALDLAEGDYQSFKRLTIEVHHWGERKFAGWISSRVWDKTTRRLSLDCSSVGMIVKDFPAGIPGTDGEPVSAFTSTWTSGPPTSEGDRIRVSEYHSMTPQKVLDILTRNMNKIYSLPGWIETKGYSGFFLGDPVVSVRDFAENYTVGNYENLFEENTASVVSIRRIPNGVSYYLITRAIIDGEWAYYRSLIVQTGIQGESQFVGFYPSLPDETTFPYWQILSDPYTSAFNVIDADNNNEQIASYVRPPEEIPPAVLEGVASKYSINTDKFQADAVNIGSVWIIVASNSEGSRLFIKAGIIQEDKFQFEYETDATVGQVLKDLAIMTDGLISFDYSGSGAPRIVLRNRETSTPANTNGLLELKRKFTEHADQTFTAPKAYNLLDTVKAGIEDFYLDRLSRESEDIDVRVLRSKVDDLSTLIPGNRLIDVEEGDLGQIIAVTPGEFDFYISCRKMANQ